MCIGTFVSSLHERDEKFFLLFKADEIAFDIKYVVSIEAPKILN